MSKEEVIVIVDFSITKMTIKDGVVIKKEKLCDIGGNFDISKCNKMNDEMIEALMLIK